MTDRSASQEDGTADRFRLALDAFPDLVAIQRTVRDAEGRVVDFVMEFVNHPDRPVGDHRRSEMVGRRLLDLFPQFAGSPVFDAMVEVATTGSPANVMDTPVTVRASTDVGPRFASVEIAPFEDGIIAVVRDVTERHQTVQALEQANQELAAAQHLAHIGVWRVDLERGRLVLSAEAAEIFGLPAGEDPTWTPGRLLDLLDPSERRRVERLIGNAGAGAFATEARFTRADGSTRQVAVFGQVVADSEPTGPGVWGTIQDLTDQRVQELALEVARDRLAEERTTVSLLQEAIVPVLPDDDRIEVGATYLPAGEANLVGGDWYDAFLVDDDHLVFAVGDVAGHGLPAAALMSQLRNAVRGLSFAGHGPEPTVAALNRLVLHAPDDEMATCIVGRLELSTGDLRWVCAGHPPPLLIDDDRASLLDSELTVPLGMRSPGEIPTNRRELAPGTLIALYSDGLIERRGERLDVGLDRLVTAATAARHLAAQQICDALTARMAPGPALTDDLCVVVFRVPPRS